MEFQRRKLRLSLAIVATGLLVALIWHGIAGWGLGRGYPDNTFLFKSDSRYSDFIQPLQDAAIPGIRSKYFPSANFIFYPFLHLPFIPGAILFLDLCIVALYVALNAALRPAVPEPGRRALACAVLLWSYPVIYVLDRGNIEILLVALVAASLLLYSRKKFTASFLALLPAICFKLYPALLLLLFFRRRLIHWIFLGMAGFFLLNGSILLALPTPLAANLAQFSDAFDSYRRDYIIGPYGVSASANAWNLFRICVWTVYSLLHGSFTWPMPDAVISAALSVYYDIFLAVLVLVTLYAVLVESSFARRAVILLLYLTVSAPAGGEYKLAYAGIALVIFILIPERRRWDLLITFALALCLIPKREVILTFVNPSDSGYHDASLNVIANPACILAAMALLMWDGWRAAGPFDWRQRLAKFARVIHWDKMRFHAPPVRRPSVKA